jgi:hypothetical protein
MKTSRYYLLPAAMGVLLLSAAPSLAQSTGESTNTSGQEETVDVSQVPKPALNAAQKALGTTPTDAKVVVGTSPQEYELMAKSKSGKEAKVYVLADGTVLKKGKPQREAKAPAPMPR